MKPLTMGRFAALAAIADTVLAYRPKAKRKNPAAVALPSAREVKAVLGQVDIGAYRVGHHDNWGDARFPWRVYGPADAEGMRELLDDFAQYREAVAFARKAQRT